jgi:hypothetical protein
MTAMQQFDTPPCKATWLRRADHRAARQLSNLSFGSRCFSFSRSFFCSRFYDRFSTGASSARRRPRRKRPAARADAVDGSACDEVAVQGNGAASVIIARDRVSRCRPGSQLESRIADNRNSQTAWLPEWQSLRLLVSITNIRSGVPPMSLIPPRFTVKLFALAFEEQTFLLGESRKRQSSVISSSLRRRWIDWEMVFQLVSMPPSQRALTKYCAERGQHRQRFLSLALGANEQDAAATGDGVGNSFQCLVEKRNGLGNR